MSYPVLMLSQSALINHGLGPSDAKACNNMVRFESRRKKTPVIKNIGLRFTLVEQRLASMYLIPSTDIWPNQNERVKRKHLENLFQ